MSIFEIIGGIVMLIASAAIMFCVMVQESPREGGLSSLGAGGGDSYFSKNQTRTKDSMINRVIAICGVIFFVVTIVVYAFSTRG